MHCGPNPQCITHSCDVEARICWWPNTQPGLGGLTCPQVLKSLGDECSIDTLSDVIDKFGTDEQNEKFLTPVAAGEKIGSFSLTEPMSGSDAGTMKSRAVLSEDGSHYVINGTKWWSSGIGDPRAKIAIVMARTENPDLDRHHQHTRHHHR